MLKHVRHVRAGNTRINEKRVTYANPYSQCMFASCVNGRYHRPSDFKRIRCHINRRRQIFKAHELRGCARQNDAQTTVNMFLMM